ncbi:MAG: hypothetical protein K0S32_209 [Bacteroidetes bacterium]|jgi:hypothetical protein|nr:hypothetical protein [Bacteroidota bacterium]
MYFALPYRGLLIIILRIWIVLIFLPVSILANNGNQCGTQVAKSKKPELISKHVYLGNTVFIYRSESVNNPFTIKIHGKTLSRDFLIIETNNDSKKYIMIEKIGASSVPTDISWESLQHISVEDLVEHCNGILLKTLKSKSRES